MGNFWYFFNFFWPSIAILVLLIGAFAIFAMAKKIIELVRTALSAIRDAITTRKPRIQLPTIIDSN